MALPEGRSSRRHQVIDGRGRRVGHAILTYTLRTIVHKVVQVPLLAAGLVLPGQASLTPLLMVPMVVTGDMLSMSPSTDRVRPSPTPSVWNIPSLSCAAIGLGLADLALCVACLCTAIFALGLSDPALRSVVVVTLVFSGEAPVYVSRERRHLWSLRPGTWLIVSPAIELSPFATLSARGLLMAPLPVWIVAGLASAASLFAFVLDAIKLFLVERFGVA